MFQGLIHACIDNERRATDGSPASWAFRANPPITDNAGINKNRGFTLIELLVVITIMGILIALLLPAVQGALESARQVQCRNNIRQLAMGFHTHLSKHGHFPAGGWGFTTTGDPDAGFGLKQPGGWVYNVLPFIGQSELREWGAGLSGEAKKERVFEVLQTPIEILNCPSRRRTILYPAVIYTQTQYGSRPDLVAKTDYAANGGETVPCHPHGCNWPSSPNPDDYNTKKNNHSGIMLQCGLVSRAMVRDGLSNTFALGEKFHNPDSYLTGYTVTDDHSMYCGWDQDTVRWLGWDPDEGRAWWPLQQDRPSYETQGFGSAHSNGSNFAFCDGSVRLIRYETSEDTQRKLTNRHDGEKLGADEY